MFEGIAESDTAQALEALLFVTDEPVGTLTLAKALDADPSFIEQQLEALKDKLENDSRGIQLREVAGGWRLFTHPAFHDLIERYVMSWDTRRMSAAALETLALIAYGQPITRAQISSVRGVTSDSVVSTLVERGYVKEVGVADTPGNPTLYGTTQTFLEYFGLKSKKDLPPLDDFAPDEKTAARIRERLGAAASFVSQDVVSQGNEGFPDISISTASDDVFGVVEKIDFDSLTFNTDDE